MCQMVVVVVFLDSCLCKWLYVFIPRAAGIFLPFPFSHNYGQCGTRQAVDLNSNISDSVWSVCTYISFPLAVGGFGVLSLGFHLRYVVL